MTVTGFGHAVDRGKPTEILIKAGQADKQYWRDLWRYRELFYFLARRDILVRYKQTVMGIGWALIRPFLTMLVFTFVFNRVAKLAASGTTPYPLLVFAGMLPWQFFATALSESSNSLISNANLISKIYFPRLIVPAASVITSFVDFLLTFAFMLVIMVWYRFWPDWRILMLPLFVGLAFLLATGVGLWLCALNVEFRDFRYIVPFVVQFGLYLSPVGFSSSIVPVRFQALYALNPMVGIIDGFRWSLLRGTSDFPLNSLLTSLLLTILLSACGVWYFRKMERTFADVI